MKFAVVGTNFISHEFAGAIAQTQSEISAVYSRKRETGEEFAKAWGIKTVHTNFEEMLADGSVEGVYIATPNSLHFSQGKMVLEAKKHLLLEKPATLTANEFDTLCEIAKKNNLAFVEAMKPHFSPTFAEIKNNIPKIGQVRHASISFCRTSSRYENFKNGIIENAFVKKFGNGALMDIGVYPITDMVMFFGKPQKIHATAEILPGSIDVSGTLTCKYENFTATIKYSKVSTTYQENEIQGENGAILYDSPSKATLFKIKTDKTEEVILCDKTNNNMIFEINFMDECVKNPSISKEYNEITKTVLQIMEEAREQVGYSFE